MNKKNLSLGIGLMIVVIIALLVSANKPNTQATQGSPPPNTQPVSRPVVGFSNSGGYSGNDPYDPSIHEFLLVTLQACVPNVTGYDSHQSAMDVNCIPQAPVLKTTPAVVPAVK